jgi:hypothetical protein
MSAPIGDRGYAYDDCPTCGTENEPFAVNGMPATGMQNWATYVCGGAGKGSANDGCGHNWAVTTERGLDHNEAMGLDTLGKRTNDVITDRFVSAPSEAYRAAYERIFGHG